MKVCPVTKLEVTQLPQWVMLSPSGVYKTHVKRIGDDIFHFNIDSDRDAVLEHFEKKLLLDAVRFSGLEQKDFYVIWDLRHIKGFSYEYTQGIAELVLNRRPLWRIAVFYNIEPEFMPVAEALKAILPEQITLLLAGSYREAMEIVQKCRAGAIPQQLQEPQDEFGILKERFLGTAARMGWLHMFNQPIPLPEHDNQLFSYLAALSSLQEDMSERHKEHQQRLADCRSRPHDLADEKKQLIALKEKEKNDLEKEFNEEKARLEDIISHTSKELDRATVSIHEQRGRIRDLSMMIVKTDIPSWQKKSLLTICQQMIETELNEKKINLVLTSTDSAFLNRLQEKHPELNRRELKICLMIRLSYDTIDIARAIGISRRGMESIWYRMHKKIGLSRHQSIKNYLNELVDEST